MVYPDNCLRGLLNDDWLLRPGVVSTTAFQFSEPGSREDGWLEESVDWEDGPDTVQLMLVRQNPDGWPQFRAGVAVLCRADIDKQIRRRPVGKGLLAYERAELEDNAHHGNLLLKAGLPTPDKRLIRAMLAGLVERVVP